MLHIEFTFTKGAKVRESTRPEINFICISAMYGIYQLWNTTDDVIYFQRAKPLDRQRFEIVFLEGEGGTGGSNYFFLTF